MAVINKAVHMFEYHKHTFMWQKIKYNAKYWNNYQYFFVRFHGNLHNTYTRVFQILDSLKTAFRVCEKEKVTQGQIWSIDWLIDGIPRVFARILSQVYIQLHLRYCFPEISTLSSLKYAREPNEWSCESSIAISRCITIFEHHFFTVKKWKVIQNQLCLSTFFKHSLPLIELRFWSN